MFYFVLFLFTLISQNFFLVNVFLSLSGERGEVAISESETSRPVAFTVMSSLACNEINTEHENFIL
jgi:hypothetical protein